MSLIFPSKLSWNHGNEKFLYTNHTMSLADDDVTFTEMSVLFLNQSILFGESSKLL